MLHSNAFRDIFHVGQSSLYGIMEMARLSGLVLDISASNANVILWTVSA